MKGDPSQHVPQLGGPLLVEVHERVVDQQGNSHAQTGQEVRGAQTNGEHRRVVLAVAERRGLQRKGSIGHSHVRGVKRLCCHERAQLSVRDTRQMP